MDKKELNKIWFKMASTGLIAPSAADKHASRLDAANTKVEATIHCDLYNGLLAGDPMDSPEVDSNIVAILEKAEEAGRTIGIICSRLSHATLKLAQEVLEEKLPDKEWALINVSDTREEFLQRATGDKPQHELLILGEHERYHAYVDAYTTVLKPSELNA